jgi:hypothetical protein
MGAILKVCQCWGANPGLFSLLSFIFSHFSTELQQLNQALKQLDLLDSVTKYYTVLLP